MNEIFKTVNITSSVWQRPILRSLYHWVDSILRIYHLRTPVIKLMSIRGKAVPKNVFGIRNLLLYNNLNRNERKKTFRRQKGSGLEVVFGK